MSWGRLLGTLVYVSRWWQTREGTSSGADDEVQAHAPEEAVSNNNNGSTARMAVQESEVETPGFHEWMIKVIKTNAVISYSYYY